eukprot:Sspe_Gene.118163::Locus_110978_Transcript_1_1_Confidence_1.000_Length_914::g.118163::m.118163
MAMEHRARMQVQGGVGFFPKQSLTYTEVKDSVTVLEVEEYARIVWNGQEGIVRVKDLEAFQAHVERSKGRDIDLREAGKKIRGSGLPVFSRPVKKTARLPPPRVLEVEELVRAGFPIPRRLIPSNLAEFVAALLERPQGVDAVKALVERVCCEGTALQQLPPLLPELPEGVRQVVRALGSTLLEASRGAHDPGYRRASRTLLAAGLGLPPSCGYGSNSVAEAFWQPFGKVVDRGTHPHPVGEEELSEVRNMLRDRSKGDWDWEGTAARRASFAFSEGGDLIP